MKTVDEIMAEKFASSPSPRTRSYSYEEGCRHALERELEDGFYNCCPYEVGTSYYDAYCYGYQYGLSVARGLKEDSGK